MRSPGQPYHPRGFGVGYVIAVGGKNIYIGGDTECVPEIKELKNIDVAFLPINAIDERFTMPPSEAAECFKAIKPKIAIPYHQGEADPNEVKKLLADMPEIEVKVYKLP